MNNKQQKWYFSTNEELEKTDTTTCGEIHTANQIIAKVATGQQEHAKLIVAAPDLLAALILAQDCLHKSEFTDNDMKFIKDTIKKTTIIKSVCVCGIWAHGSINGKHECAKCGLPRE